MKKVLFALTAFLGLGLALVATSCGGGGGGGSDDEDVMPSGESTTVPDGFVAVQGATITGTIEGSHVFIAGRTVTIPCLWVSDHEVTQAEYETYCTYSESNSPSTTYGDGNNYPVYYVSWYDALVYCNKRSIEESLMPCYTINGKTNPSEWGTVPTSSDSTWNDVSWNHSANGYRLPTEAEWEYAARGGASGCSASNPTDYAGADDGASLGAYAWYYDNAYVMGAGNAGYGTHAVKTKASNSLGLYDMSGNVWEWCWDWHGSISTSTESTGASSGSNRVRRGGSWDIATNCCSVAFRFMGYPYGRYSYLGFRVVRSAG